MHRINTGDSNPIRTNLRPQAKYHQDIVSEFTKRWSKHNYIEESESEWASAVIVVERKGDYRRLNSVTKKNAYPVPNLESQKQYFRGAKVFSQLDFADAYLQILIHPDDREKTAIITHDGLFHFIRMPFGLCNAPATFLRAVDQAFRIVFGSF